MLDPRREERSILTYEIVGPYRADISPAYDQEWAREALARVDGLMVAPSSDVIAAGRNRLVRVPVNGEAWMIKVFGERGFASRVSAWQKGSKALRAWRIACHLREQGVGTPTPVAVLEPRRSGGGDSILVTRWVEDAVSFHDELIRLFHTDPICEKFMTLLERVACAIREMHLAGVLHNDLGNQNILLRRDGEADWKDVQFVDLNRARRFSGLGERQRGRDLSRINLPSDLLRVFREMYYADVPSAEFLSWERHYRRRYAIHAATRAWRHPVRERRIRRRETGKADYPARRDMWIWDERSAQAISTMVPRERRKYYPRFRNMKMVADTLLGASTIWGDYHALLEQCYAEPVTLKGRIGVALDPHPDRFARELTYWEMLGRPPVFIRLYHHEPEALLEFRLGAIADLAAQGVPVYAAIVQSRRAVNEASSWRRFVDVCFSEAAAHVEAFELAHAVNRVKWGIWTIGEWRGLMDGVAEIARRYPDVMLSGPAAIDFEYPFVASALRNLPKGMHLGALSHHLYVDRRGAPENPQGSFSALEKFALARAIARASSACEDRLVVSEVNWPLKGTGPYSPVTSPYESPGIRLNDPSVSESDYADYMIRYLLIALCSGMVDRVYWWRLAARGFGLVDDSDPERWRPRPAFEALRHFLAGVGAATFTAHNVELRDANTSVKRFRFRDAADTDIDVVYAHPGSGSVKDTCTRIVDVRGGDVAPSKAFISGSPLYLHGVKNSRHHVDSR